MVPAMIYFLGMSQHRSQGTSLFVIIPTAIVGAWVYSLNGNVPLNSVLWIVIGSMTGAFAGSFFANRISEKALKITYGIFMLAIGAKFLLGI